MRKILQRLNRCGLYPCSERFLAAILKLHLRKHEVFHQLPLITDIPVNFSDVMQ